MKLRKWNIYEKRFEIIEESLKLLLTVMLRYVLISFLKPEDEWTKVDYIKARCGNHTTIDVAMNHGQVADVTYLRNPDTNEGWILKRESTIFEKFTNKMYGFNDIDKTCGNRYIFEGTFEEFVKALEAEGFEIED